MALKETNRIITFIEGLKGGMLRKGFSEEVNVKPEKE